MKRYLPHLRTAAFCLLLLAIPIVFLYYRFGSLFDSSARRTEAGVTWQGHTYVTCSYTNYIGGRTLARTNDGFTIVAIKGDPDHHFVVLSSFLDSTLCVREDYEIPKEGKLNGVYWCLRKRIVDPDFRAAVSSILANFHADFVYETDEMYTKTESRHLHAVSFCYEDCPVGVNPWDCYMGLLDGEWVFARRTSRQKDENGKWSFTYDVYRIPAEHHEILEVYWIA